MYRPTQYVDYQSMPGCKVSRRTFRPAKNNSFSSEYGKRNDKHILRCGQYDDAPWHRFGTRFGGCRFPAANNRGRSFSRSPSPAKRRAQRLHELAYAKKSGCGPNCKYSRCAANDPCYALPFYTPNEGQDRRLTKKIGQIPSPSLLRNTCGRMAQIREISKRVGDNMIMGLKYLQEVQDPRNVLDVLPMIELSCEGDCAQCTPRGTPHEQIRGGAGHGEGVPERTSTRTPNETGMKSMTTKSVASNTEGSCYDRPESHEVPTRTLKDVNSNSTLERSNKQTSPIPIEKTPAPTPIPRVALLRRPRPSPPQNMTKKDQLMIRYALQQDRLMTPQHAAPRYGHVVPSPTKSEPTPPLLPLHRHEASSTPKPKATPLPPPLVPLYGHEPPPDHEPELPPFHSLETSTPISLTSRRETPPSKIHPQPERQKWLPGKLSPRLHTPPVVKMTYPTQTPSISPQSQSTQQNQSHYSRSPAPKSPPVASSPPSRPPTQTPTLPPTQPPTQPPTRLQSPLTSDYDSDVTTTNSDSETPTACLCSLCGKSENASAMTMAVYKNNNNPLYGLASPLQSPARDGHCVVTMGVGPSRVRYLALEVIVLLVLGGLVTLGLMSFVESVFGAYLAGSCGCSGAGGKGPQLMADGLKSGVVNWVSCPMHVSRVKLTPAR